MIHASVHLLDVPMQKLQLVKETILSFGDQDHSRWVFQVPRECGLFGGSALYAKIWNSTYVRCDNIVHGINAGFYDDQTTPALAGLIVHKGVCRGYLTRPCRPSYVFDPSFYALIKERTSRTGLFTYQFSPYHVMRYGDRNTLIDLEGIYAIGDLSKMSGLHCEFDYSDYERFVSALSKGVMRAEVRTPSHFSGSSSRLRSSCYAQPAIPCGPHEQFMAGRGDGWFPNPARHQNHIHLIEM